MLIRVFFLFLGFGLGQIGWSDDVPMVHVRVIPVGQLPTPVIKLQDGIRVIQPPKEGELPPNPALIKTSKTEMKPMGLIMNKASSFVSLDPRLKNFEAFKDKSHFLKKALPKFRQSLAVLFPNHRRMNWFSPEVLFLKDDLKSFPIGSVRFINISDRPVFATLPGMKFQLPPGRSKVVTPKRQSTRMRLQIRGKSGSPVSLFDNSVLVEKGTRANVFLWKPKKAVNPVMASVIPDDAPKPPKVKRKSVK